MPKKRTDNQKHRPYLAGIRVAATLIDSPTGFEEIVRRSFGYRFPLGLFKVSEQQARDQAVFVKEQLEFLIGHGWIICQGESYALTSLGREEVSKRLSQLSETGVLVRKFFQPQTVSKVTLGIHFALAALKLPAALLSGSVGLLNDALDTLLDGLSSLLVYFGIRFQKMQVANAVLVMLMLATGILTLYEAVRRFLAPYEPEVDWFAFLAVTLSACICLGLWAYQRYVGLRSGILALITQSVDSRNHVIVATSVTVGLVASRLRFPLLDTLVGLGVAILILKSAVELSIETIRSLGEEETDLSRFKFFIDVRFQKFRQTHLRDWMLYLVEKGGISGRGELITRAGQALDFNQIPAVRAMELAQGPSRASELVEGSLEELFERGWLTGDQQLRVTEAGRKQLNKFV
jgi:hypothetical protein